VSILNEYIAPLVQPEKKIKPIWKSLKNTWEILLHGLVPHQSAKPASKQILEDSISEEGEEYLAELSMVLYKESTQRIDGLEEKGFKLLTYISAVSAISIYFMSRDISGIFKITVIVSLLFLVMAIVISLRCIGVKQQKVLFIDSIFDFREEHKPKSKNKKAIIANLVNCAVFNQTVADNTADILRASRFMLSIGIWTTAISCIFFLSEESGKSKVYEVKLADSAVFRSIMSDLQMQSDSTAKLTTQIQLVKKQVDSIKSFSKSEIDKERVKR
jgi:hypothetical protein